MSHTELIVMLTKDDRTIQNAADIFQQCKNTSNLYWGMKEEGINLMQMKDLFYEMHLAEKKTVLEVVAYSEEEGMRGARMAHECGCDLLIGTNFTERILDYCEEHEMKYMPFIGTVTGRPSVLKGSIEQMERDIIAYKRRGVFGVDLLGYRYEKNADELISRMVSASEIPICVAGSIRSFQQIDTVLNAGAWGFTIGGAFFDRCFGNSIKDQIENVCHYIRMGEKYDEDLLSL